MATNQTQQPNPSTSTQTALNFRRRRQLNSAICWNSPLNNLLHQREKKAEKFTVVIRVPAYEAEVGNSSNSASPTL
ncbi:hypothetical protein CEXT_367061 [Caerostris extrusa]|uniref:Uncharacterized protein n=1 Tax=Caerostris extrusa TaxID=172846 RepID=A0AAV4NKB5_CAEEX|nr:hypothetical protein CEXT_367061 [Caerostris extrusa]